jgi:hypothetical protein
MNNQILTLLLGLLIASSLALSSPALATSPQRGPRRMITASRAKLTASRAKLKTSAAKLKTYAHRLGQGASRFSRRTGLTRLRLKVSARLHLAGAYCTLAADRVQACLPRPLARGFGKLRMLSLGNMGSFAGKKFVEDPGFLTTFGVASPIAWHLTIPVAIAAGVNPAVAIVGHEIIEAPFNIGVILWRQHYLAKQANPNQTFWRSMKQVGRDYRDNAEVNQARNRRRLRLYKHMRASALERRAEATPSRRNPLQALGAKLTGAR